MYKTILMYADQFSGFERRLQVAAALASEADSHLIGTVASGGPQLDYLVYGAVTLAPPPPIDYEPLRDAAREQLARFQEWVLGGTTQSLLSQSRSPVLLGH
ncbi:hypothetical protein [Janthinobacterium sp. HLS12-2]|uniref:hypothetical protein n=1 Tax=Janthinobacterium sp. HLS12-2 TaxID=1259324 RepID=UPI003F250F6D